jgi:thermosome
LKEDVRRDLGEVAVKSNIMVARIVSEIVRSTLGPRGMDKAIIGKNGDFIITNDGATILKKVKLEHPTAKIMVEAADAQDAEVGDGTTTSVVLAGELLTRAEGLLNQGVHAAIIINGFSNALQKAIDVLERIAVSVDVKNDEALKEVAKTAMNAKIIRVVGSIDRFSELAVKLARKALEEYNKKLKLDLDNIKIVKKEGASLNDSVVVDGYVIDDREIVNPDMPTFVENASIALIRGLEIKELSDRGEEPGKTTRLTINALGEYETYLGKRSEMVKKIINKIEQAGANVVLVNRGLDEVFEHHLAKAEILAVKRIFKPDMERIARLTGGTVVASLNELTSEKLGHAEAVEEWKISRTEKCVLIKGCKGSRASSVILRGGVTHILDEAERALHDALCTVKNTIEDPRVIFGGGSPEMEIASHLRKYAPSVGGKEQLAVEAFAEAMEIIPKTLAENAGLDLFDTLGDLRVRHSRGEIWAGVDVLGRKTTNMKKMKVYEPLKVKLHALKVATSVAKTILRIDEVLVRKRIKGEKPPQTEEEYEEREKKLTEALKKELAPTKLSKKLGTTEDGTSDRFP